MKGIAYLVATEIYTHHSNQLLLTPETGDYIFNLYFYKKINMATKEIKEKINNVIDNIPDDVLEDVLEYLKALTHRSKNKIHLSQNLSKILDEDKTLLERLAQ